MFRISTKVEGSGVCGNQIFAEIPSTVFKQAQVHRLAKPTLTVLIGHRACYGTLFERIIHDEVGALFDLRFHRFGDDTGMNAWLSGADLLLSASRHRFDLIVAYCSMTEDDRNRFAVLRQRYGKPIIVVSGWLNPELVEKPYLGGVEIYLPAPFALAEFRSALKRCLGTKSYSARAKELADFISTTHPEALVAEAKRISEPKGNLMSEANVTAFDLLHLAAIEGHGEAQYRVFGCYAHGRGVHQNHAKAAEWLRKAAESDYLAALFRLGFYYYRGGFVGGHIPHDETEAIKWLQRATDAGVAGACGFLAEIHEQRGEFATALKWYAKALELGDPDHIYSACKLCGRGKSAGIEIVDAYAWFSLAAEETMRATASEAATELAALMSADQLASALVLSDAFKRRYRAGVERTARQS